MTHYHHSHRRLSGEPPSRVDEAKYAAALRQLKKVREAHDLLDREVAASYETIAMLRDKLSAKEREEALVHARYDKELRQQAAELAILRHQLQAAQP